MSEKIYINVYEGAPGSHGSSVSCYGPFASSRDARLASMVVTDPFDNDKLRKAGKGVFINVYTDSEIKTAKLYPEEFGYKRFKLRAKPVMHRGWKREPFKCKTVEDAFRIAEKLSAFEDSK